MCNRSQNVRVWQKMEVVDHKHKRYADQPTIMPISRGPSSDFQDKNGTLGIHYGFMNHEILHLFITMAKAWHHLQRMKSFGNLAL